jgi:protein-disulfide isomerase/uncharacterized membrane protein
MNPGTSSYSSLRAIIFALLLMGIAISSVALHEHVVYSEGLATGPSFCNISQHINCEAVNASEWSTILGIPIASYGIFFYVALLALLVVATCGCAMPVEAALSVIVLGGCVASISSVALFALSELVIGALCLLCIALYLINFALFGVTWRVAFRGRLVVGLADGVQALWYVLRLVVLGGEGSGLARLAVVALTALACFCVYLPSAIYSSVAGSVSATKTELGNQSIDPVKVWQEEPAVVIDSKIGGAFGAYAKGTPSAPIQIVEFADFECPGCRHLYVSLQQLLARFEGKYQLVFRNYPLDQACNPSIKHEFHQYACLAAMFTRCAGEQGKFWEALDVVFTDPILTGEAPVAQVRDALVTRAAESLSLDREAISECLGSDRYLATLHADIAAGNAAGLEGTPALWVNGKLVRRPSIDALEKIFSSIVHQSK